METSIQEIVCPVCAGTTTYRYEKDGFRIYCCQVCGVLFVGNPPTSTAEIYDEAYFIGGNTYGGYANCDAEKAAMRPTLEKSLTLVGSKGKLLDVGAATGYFTMLAKERGWEAEGIDISPAAAALAREKGREVRSGTLEQGAYRNEAFDAVTFFDVLEHVPDPVTFIKEVARITKPGGRILLSTPDTGSLYARLMGRRWHLVCPPEHLVLFNQKNLKRVLEGQGFRVLWVGRLPKRFTPPYIFQTASRWLKLPFLARIGEALAHTWLQKLSIPLDFRDNMFALAEKHSRVPFVGIKVPKGERSVGLKAL